MKYSEHKQTPLSIEKHRFIQKKLTSNIRFLSARLKPECHTQIRFETTTPTILSLFVLRVYPKIDSTEISNRHWCVCDWIVHSTAIHTVWIYAFWSVPFCVSSFFLAISPHFSSSAALHHRTRWLAWMCCSYSVSNPYGFRMRSADIALFQSLCCEVLFGRNACCSIGCVWERKRKRKTERGKWKDESFGAVYGVFVSGCGCSPYHSTGLN